MVREIKTTLALDGEKAFNAALREAEREMRVMNADLKAMAAEYKATDDTQKYFTERNEILGRKIKQQEEYVEALSRAVKEAAEKYGDAAELTDGYRIKLSNATAKLFDMRREADAAARELEDLGRDSEKVGRQLERGIGDAAEDVEDKLDGMFDKVSSDVNALKSSVAFQTTMDVGEFVLDGINSVVDFVNENTELNRQISIAKHNIEQYDFNWEEARGLIVRAAAVTGNQEGAFEAISNLVAAGFDTEELMYSAVDALLGAYLKTGGALSFESLAEDFRATVVSRVPTGTYAEVIEEVLQGVVVDDVKAALEGAENVEDAIEIALAVLTEGGLQKKTKSYEEANAELIEQQVKQQELALKWAELAEEGAPIVAKVTDFTAEAVDKLIEMVKTARKNIKDIEDIFGNPDETVLNKEWWKQNTREKYPEFAEWLGIGPGKETAFTFVESIKDNGSVTLPSIFDDPNLQIDYEPVLKEAETAGKNVSISIANGVAEEAPKAVANVMNMVDQMNAALNMIAVPNIQFGNIGFSGYGYTPNITLAVDGDQMGKAVYNGVSKAASSSIQTTMLVK